MSLIAYSPLVLFVWLPLLLFYWGLNKSLYWKRKKIPSIKAKPLIGSIAGIFSFEKSIADFFYDFYFDESTKGKPFVGIHMFHKPAIVIRDPELIKKLLVKDFASFSNRWVYLVRMSERLEKIKYFFYMFFILYFIFWYRCKNWSCIIISKTIFCFQF